MERFRMLKNSARSCLLVDISSFLSFAKVVIVS